MRQYRSNPKDCAACSFKEECIGSGAFKTIAVTSDKELFEKMNRLMQTPEAVKMKKLRSSTVEPVLGTLVNFLGMRRVNTKGISLANKCMTMAAIAYNLKKVLKFSIQNELIKCKATRHYIDVLADSIIDKFIGLLFSNKYNRKQNHLTFF